MQFRKLARSLLDRAAAFTGILAKLERRMSRGVTVLMYHRVLPDEQCRTYPIPPLAMPVSVFRQQVQWLATHCSVLPLAVAMADRDPGASRERPVVSLTFDDGYYDNYTLAAPILEEIGLRGTFFVTVGFAETGRLMWFDRAAILWERSPELARRRLRGLVASDCHVCAGPQSSLRDWIQILKRRDTDGCLAGLELGDDVCPVESELTPFRPMTVGQVAELHSRGHEIGSHCVTHRILTHVDDEAVLHELTCSREKLTHWLGAPPAGLSYPNGDWDDRILRAAHHAGYRYACTTEPGINLPADDRYALRRFDVGPSRVTRSGGGLDLLAFRAEISCLHHALRRLTSFARLAK